MAVAVPVLFCGSISSRVRMIRSQEMDLRIVGNQVWFLCAKGYELESPCPPWLDLGDSLEQLMSLVQEFKAFVAKGNVVDLAVAVVLGGAFGKIVTAFVSGLIMPLVSYLLPKGDWQAFMLGKFQVGALMGAVIDFLLIALVVFLVFVKGLAAMTRKKEETLAPPDTKTCPRCLEAIPKAATRCKFCTSEFEA